MEKKRGPKCKIGVLTITHVHNYTFVSTLTCVATLVYIRLLTTKELNFQLEKVILLSDELIKTKEENPLTNMIIESSTNQLKMKRKRS